MKKNGLKILFFLLGTTLNAQNFPYSNSLQHMNQFSVIDGGSREKEEMLNQDIEGTLTRGVLLTPDSQSEFNGISLANMIFLTDRGFSIDFEYFQWGNSERYNSGDGLALILYDGTQTAPSMGVEGAGLGYTYFGSTNNSSGEIYKRSGFTDGYVAFGLDTYGNFHQRRGENYEWRNGAIRAVKGSSETYYTRNWNSAISAFPENSSFFTVRGAAHNAKWLKSGNITDNNKGYPLLYAVNTFYEANSNRIGEYNGVSLSSTNDGTHEPRYVSTFDSAFDIRGGSYTDIPNSTGYRKAHIQFKKGIREYYNTDGTTLNYTMDAYFMTVYIDTETGSYKVAENEAIPISFVRKYLEANGSMNDGNQYIGNNVVTDYIGKAPATLGMAFTASTGAAYQNQLVRNVNISLPFSPVVADDVVFDVCPDRKGETILNPLVNDVAFNDNIYIHKVKGTPTVSLNNLVDIGTITSQPSINSIDVNSFKFMNYNSSTGKHEPTFDPYVNKVTGLGTFYYIKESANGTLLPADCYVAFVPESPTSALGKSQLLYYNIKNKPGNTSTGVDITAEDYRSSIATMSINFRSTICGKSHIITNKNVSEVK